MQLAQRGELGQVANLDRPNDSAARRCAQSAATAAASVVTIPCSAALVTCVAVRPKHKRCATPSLRLSASGDPIVAAVTPSRVRNEENRPRGLAEIHLHAVLQGSRP